MTVGNTKKSTVFPSKNPAYLLFDDKPLLGLHTPTFRRNGTIDICLASAKRTEIVVVYKSLLLK